MIRWEYHLEFKNPVSLFSGLAVAGMVDRMVIRDHENLPYILGSSVKGRWRFFAERLLSSGIFSDKNDGLHIHSKEEPACKSWHKNACALCRLFGNETIPSLIRVGQASLDSKLKPAFRKIIEQNQNSVVRPDSEIRPGIAISRKRKAALPGHLFFDEVIPPAKFNGEIFINGDITPEEEAFLRNTARLVDGIGGRKSIGRGRLTKGIYIEGGAKCSKLP